MTAARAALLAVLTLGLVGASTGPAAGRIVALGDSITYGYPDPATGWTVRLGIDNAGIPGNRTDQMLARAPDVLATRPRLVLVMGGTNDLAHGVPLPTIVANLTAIVDEIRGDGVEPVLLTIAPPSQRSWVPRVDALNDAVRGIARTEGVRLIDVNAALAGPDGTFAPGCSVDGVHPTPAGYAAIARVVGAAIGSTSSA